MTETAAQEKAALKAKIKEAKEKLRELSTSVNEKLGSKWPASSAMPGDDTVKISGKLKTKRKLGGHFGKVVSIGWGREGERAMTASQDGHVIIWNALSATKAHVVPLKSSWVMFAEMSQEGAELFATGGLDNVATIWQTPTSGSAYRLQSELYGHDGYVCSARFLSDAKLLTTSGDGTAGLWDLSKPRGKSEKDVDDRVSVYKGHEKDVSSIDLHPECKDTFLTSSTDGSCMLWSVNETKPTSVMRIYQKDVAGKPPLIDINKTKFAPSGTALAMATEAMGTLLYDARSQQGPLNIFDSTTPDMRDSAKYSVAFSKSGRLLFVACEDYSIEVWDTLAPDQKKPLQSLSTIHTARVTDVAVPSTGLCLGAVSWDTFGSITAP